MPVITACNLLLSLLCACSLSEFMATPESQQYLNPSWLWEFSATFHPSEHQQQTTISGLSGAILSISACLPCIPPHPTPQPQPLGRPYSYDAGPDYHPPRSIAAAAYSRHGIIPQRGQQVRLSCLLLSRPERPSCR